MTAWVRTNSQFRQGNIMRKRVDLKDGSRGQTCWGLSLDVKDGLTFSYGAHDFFQTDPDIEAPRRTVVTIDQPNRTTFKANQLEMVSVVVTRDTVSFYRAGTVNVGSVALRRPLTDCSNKQEGMLLGDPNMEMAMVKYFPRALDPSELEELLEAGSVLSDLATGSNPALSDKSRLEAMEVKMDAMSELISATAGTRQQQSWVNAIVQTAAQEKLAPQSPYASPPASRVINATLGVEDTLNSGREYTQLVKGPYRLTRPEDILLDSSRHITGVPDWQTSPDDFKGVTFMTWYRHTPCETATCGGYFIHSPCWSWFYEQNRASGTMAGIGWVDFLDYSEKRFLPEGDKIWRHLAHQWNEETNELKYFQDGVLMGSKTFVPNADFTCPNLAEQEKISLGFRNPGWTWGWEAEVFDLRMYVHKGGGGSKQGPLTDAEIWAVANQQYAELNNWRCIGLADPRMKDSAWVDPFGNGCEWYSKESLTRPQVCEYPPASANCVLSCKPYPECFDKHVKAPLYFSWDRIRLIGAKSENGTLCLGSHLNSTEVVAQCREWVAGGQWSSIEDKTWFWDWHYTVGNAGRRVNITDCDVLAEAIDDTCQIDTEQVRSFTRDTYARGGDYTLMFFAKPTGSDSFFSEGQFFPHIEAFSSISPPRTQSMTQQRPTRQWINYMDKKCYKYGVGTGNRYESGAAEMHAASSTDWSFYAISRVNKTEDGVNGKWESHGNLGMFYEGDEQKECFTDPTSWMNAFAVYYPMLMSPLIMVPKYMTRAEIQKFYHATVNTIKMQQGPMASSHEQSTKEAEVEKQDYGKRSSLVASPLLFQTRQNLTFSCPFSYGDTFIKKSHAKMVASRCKAPFSCSDNMVEEPATVLSCPGSSFETEKAFDIEPLQFDGQVGYSDFLYSITDSPFLSRDGKVSKTGSFIDSRTTSVLLLLAFYTPQAGITTVMKVSVDFAGDNLVDTDVSVQHFEVLEGSALTWYVCISIFNLVFIVIMLVDIGWSASQLVRRTLQTSLARPKPVEWLKQAIDLSTALMVIAFVAMRLPQKMNSSDTTLDILDRIVSIEWSNTTLSLAQKKQDFFNYLTDLLDVIAYQEALDSFCSAILFISLMRVVQCTSVHPRLALLTGTLTAAADDLFHATILIVVLLSCFAGIGTWAFGATREDFGDFDKTMQTQFLMMFGNFPEDWTESQQMMVYTTLYLIFIFILLQNFLLAIIVESYMGIREQISESQVEDNFLTDLYDAGSAHIMAPLMGWPSSTRLGDTLGIWEAKWSVGYIELSRTGAFKSQAAIISFLKHYSRYDFLEVERIQTYSPAKSGEELAHLIQKQMYSILSYGTRAPTLRDEVEFAKQLVENKRRNRGQSKDNGSNVLGGDAKTEPDGEQRVADAVVTLKMEPEVCLTGEGARTSASRKRQEVKALIQSLQSLLEEEDSLLEGRHRAARQMKPLPSSVPGVRARGGGAVRQFGELQRNLASEPSEAELRNLDPPKVEGVGFSDELIC
eukprot:CAMPEP_0169429860 /NCGR_PEP_ID=MMETSP1042-20121227/2089_1 /TAXON_ID=464988 /ORGANISM="Hemiselmis andersenii, Strain CCMP1180" /LENGTH=1492 /DNA_ID=CAMNT_0009540133 /DNA_START=27 /DNA_END=4505 /DNA_ORIENTATION=+